MATLELAGTAGVVDEEEEEVGVVVVVVLAGAAVVVVVLAGAAVLLLGDTEADSVLQPTRAHATAAEIKEVLIIYALETNYYERLYLNAVF